MIRSENSLYKRTVFFKIYLIESLTTENLSKFNKFFERALGKELDIMFPSSSDDDDAISGSLFSFLSHPNA